MTANHDMLTNGSPFFVIFETTAWISAFCFLTLLSALLLAAGHHLNVNEKNEALIGIISVNFGSLIHL